jgi:hypothetical protein
VPTQTRDSVQSEPDHYILIAPSVEREPKTDGREITETLANSNVWLVSQDMPFRRSYKRGDRALFFVPGPRARYFLGDAVVAGPVAEATPQDKRLADQLGLQGFEERIPLESVRVWKEPLPIRPLVLDLQFVKHKQSDGLGLRQAAALIPAEDFQLILREAAKHNPFSD